jgi:glycosyltransferase involved in cell wall biosynthesis
MNICILSKFPPLQGGISAKTYWLAKGYAEAGHSVHVISNGPLIEEEYKIDGCYPHLLKMHGITMHEISEQLPWHIPNEPETMSRLIEKFLNIHEKYSIDLIDAGYLVPYGIAAYLLRTVTGVPYIIRHGGSDLHKFVRAEIFRDLVRRTLAFSSLIITDNKLDKSFTGFTHKLHELPPYVPHIAFSRKKGQLHSKFPTILYLGKINWHFDRKGLDKIISIIPLLKRGWKLRIIGQGLGEHKLRQVFQEKNNGSLEIAQFIPPWQIPRLLRTINYVFCMNYNDYSNYYSNLLLESLFCGAIPIVNQSSDLSAYECVVPNIAARVLRVSSDSANTITNALYAHWAKKKEWFRYSPPKNNYREYMRQNLQILDKIVKKE